MNNTVVDFAIKLINENLNKDFNSLPVEPEQLLRKIQISFPNLLKTIKASRVTSLKDEVLKFYCKLFNVFIQRSPEEYSKVDVIIRKNGKNVLDKAGVFFEDLERTLTSASRGMVNEYEVGDLDKFKTGKKVKIGTNSDSIRNVATSLSAAIEPTSGNPNMQTSILASATDRFEDLDKVINTGRFRSAVGDPKVYQKIKKSANDAKRKK